MMSVDICLFANIPCEIRLDQLNGHYEDNASNDEQRICARRLLRRWNRIGIGARARLDCQALAIPIDLGRINVRIKERFLLLIETAVIRARSGANGARWTKDDNIIFATQLCALLILWILLLVRGARTQARLGIANTHGRTLFDSILCNDGGQSRIRLTLNGKTAVLGTCNPQRRILGKLVLVQSRIPLRTVGRNRIAIVDVPVGWAIRQARKASICSGTLGGIILGCDGLVRRSARALPHGLESRLTHVLTQSRNFAILRHANKLHALGTRCQVKLIGCA